MEQVTKEDQHRNEQTIYQCRTEAGLVALRFWVLDRQAQINRKWYNAPDDQVKAFQGEARMLDKLLKLLEHGPAIKTAPTERAP